MLSPIDFIKQYENCFYGELLVVRDEFMEELKELEVELKNEDSLYEFEPSLDMVYYWNLIYLKHLLDLIYRKFKEENL